jgi:hypothetical protein
VHDADPVGHVGFTSMFTMPTVVGLVLVVLRATATNAPDPTLLPVTSYDSVNAPGVACWDVGFTVAGLGVEGSPPQCHSMLTLVPLAASQLSKPEPQTSSEEMRWLTAMHELDTSSCGLGAAAAASFIVSSAIDSRAGAMTMAATSTVSSQRQT